MIDIDDIKAIAGHRATRKYGRGFYLWIGAGILSLMLTDLYSGIPSMVAIVVIVIALGIIIRRTRRKQATELAGLMREISGMKQPCLWVKEFRPETDDIQGQENG